MLIQWHWICVVGCRQHVDIGGVKVVSSAHLLFNFYDVVDGLLLRCSGSGIGSVWLIVSNTLTLEGRKLFPVCICFFNFYDVGDGFLLRCGGSGIGTVTVFVSSMLTLDGSELFPVCICFLIV